MIVFQRAAGAGAGVPCQTVSVVPKPRLEARRWGRLLQGWSNSLFAWGAGELAWAVFGLAFASFSALTGQEDAPMPNLLYLFVPGDRVRITTGILHGFTATVATVERPDRVAVVVDELEGENAVIVNGECLELYEGGQVRG